MTTLTLPLTHTPSFVLLASALFKNADVKWDTESGEQGEVTYGDVHGLTNVRTELERGIPGKEVSLMISYILRNLSLAAFPRLLFLLYLHSSRLRAPFRMFKQYSML